MGNLTRRDPLEDLFRGFFVRPVEFSSPLAEASIKMDIKEAPEAYTVHAELPGVKKEDIHVTVEGNVVTIAAETRQEKEVKEGEHLLRSERTFGKLSRSFQLAENVDEAGAKARFTEGVLELTLPKKAPASNRRLAIE